MLCSLCWWWQLWAVVLPYNIFVVHIMHLVPQRKQLDAASCVFLFFYLWSPKQPPALLGIVNTPFPWPFCDFQHTSATFCLYEGYRQTVLRTTCLVHCVTCYVLRPAKSFQLKGVPFEWMRCGVRAMALCRRAPHSLVKPTPSNSPCLGLG